MTTKSTFCLVATILFSAALATPASPRDAGERTAPEPRAATHPFMGALAAEDGVQLSGLLGRSGRNCARKTCISMDR